MRRMLMFVLSVVVLWTALAGAAYAAAGDEDPAWNNGDRKRIFPPLIPGAVFNDSAGQFVLIDGSGRPIVAGGVDQENGQHQTIERTSFITRLTTTGAIDTSYATNGFITARGYAGASGLLPQALEFDSSNRVHAAFNGNDDLGVAARYTSNGTLDSGYGSGGVASVSLAAAGFWNMRAGAIGRDGSSYFVFTDFNSPRSLRITRIDPNGNADPTYETNSALSGLPAESNDGQGDAPTFAQVDSQNRLLVGRSFKTSTPGGDVVRRVEFRRFTATGAPDTTYGTNGRATPTYPGNATDNGRLRDMQILPNDELLFGVTAHAAPAPTYIAKLSSSGTLLNGNGQFGAPSMTGTTDWLQVFQAADGLVYAVQQVGAEARIRRYTANGQPDTQFSDDGLATDAEADPFPLEATVTSNGRLYVVGAHGPATLARYLTKDPSLAPDLVTAPHVTGTPSPGQTLNCAAGSWTTSPTVEVFWDRAPRSTTSDDDPAWMQLPTLGRSYTVTDADQGSRLRCRERATNINGVSDGPSNSLRVDLAGPTLLRAPTVSGIPVKGLVLNCDPGEWSNNPDLTATWLRDGAAIPNVSTLSYLLKEEDRRHRITCEVSASNDVGSAGPARATNDLLAVGEPPRNLRNPTISLARFGPKATDLRITCGDGEWDEDYGQYDYRWLREGAEIAGATGKTYDAHAEDLGTNLRCEAYSTNPAGRSSRGLSLDQLVPLPASGEPGHIYTGGGYNRLDPLNLLAVTRAWKDKMAELTLARRRAAADALKKDCATGEFKNRALPNFAQYTDPGPGVLLSAADTCAVLLKAPANQIQFPSSGIYWSGTGGCRVPYTDQTGGPPCPTLRVTVPRLNAASPPSAITALEQASLDQIKPVRVLWDFNKDGKTDASCDPDAPILRTLPNTGTYDIRAVIISADSEATGVYSVTDLKYAFNPRYSGQVGSLRPAQPFACKTTLIPPEEPAQPCINEVTVGRTHLAGNICPVSARTLPTKDLDGLPRSVQAMLEKQALDAALKPVGMPSKPLPTDVDYGLGIGFRAEPGSLPYVTTRQVDALSSIGTAAPAAVPKKWADALKSGVPGGFNDDEAQHAMDQIYIVRGQAKINGIDLDPKDGSVTVLVPSDAGKALNDVKQMTLSSRKAALSLGGVPIGEAEALSRDLQDKVGGAAPTLRSANLDDLRAELLKKLDLGPFKLGGDAKVRMADDGTAFIEALAELKGPFKAGSSAIRTGVTIRANQSGKLSLAGIHLEVKKASMGAVVISDMLLDYNGDGLTVAGKLLFPPIYQGIAINRFRLDGNGNFRELDVDYLAGAGQGINIGPGIFLIKLGGGLSLNPDEIRGRAGVSFGPSAGGGCPTAGVDADLNVHFGRPPPFFVDARSTVELVCIPIGNAHFYADATGLVDIEAGVSLDLGLVYASAALHGRLNWPNWQIDMRGKGGIRHLLKAEIKALISNLGIAGCGRVEVFPETPISDPVTLAGGAAIRFSGGRPPFTYAELLANFRLFTGCDLRPYSPFGRGKAVLKPAQADGSRTFTIPTKDAPEVIALEVVGAGGAPRVQVVNPKGETLDASQFGEDFVKTPNISGLQDPGNSRTLLFLRGAPGKWTVKPVEGSVPITDIKRAEVLPAPKVTAKVGGVGASRILQYNVASVPGQTVRFVEQSQKGQRVIKTVKGGGSGKANFITSEGPGTRRTVLAQISQDGMPRETLTVARFSAPAPKPARPKVKVRRRGSKVTLSWGRDPYAKRFEVYVITGRGKTLLIEPKGRARSAKFGGLAKGEGARIRVTGITEAGRRGPTRIVKVKGSLKDSSAPDRTRWDNKRSRTRRGK